MSTPYFSIIIPVYNREKSIGRAIESCLSQSFEDYEIVVVDDGSVDGSAKEVEGYLNSRIRLIKHRQNKGPCPARNTGISHSSGRWVLMLDSDFSFVDGALNLLYKHTDCACSEIGNLATCCLWDSNQVSPIPTISDCSLDYVDYLKWSDTLVVSEYFNCIRRDVFNSVMYPDSRAWETLFHLNLAKEWRISLCSDLSVRIYTDASNRLTTARGYQAYTRILLDAEDRLQNIYDIWALHGKAIKEYAPNREKTMYREAARLSFLCGYKRAGIRYISNYLRAEPNNLRGWLILVWGIVSPKALAWANTFR
ncbi:MAG: glycosyltransferase family 2 protein [Anaerolineaceae bacterium]|nr:glycosyltransferase family 2 protein [Anaerolineaceae bacterium]